MRVPIKDFKGEWENWKNRDDSSIASFYLVFVEYPSDEVYEVRGVEWTGSSGLTGYYIVGA